MAKRKISQKAQLNNSGSTLITVLVGVGFLLILATMTIAISAANLHMKQIEQNMKDNFYADEQILDDVFNGIGKVTTDCLSNAYADVLTQVTDSDGKAVFTTQDAAYRAFSLRFINDLIAVMPVCSSVDGDTSNYDGLRARLNSYITKDAAMAEVVRFTRTEILNEDNQTWDELDPSQLPCKYVFRDVEVKYKQVTGDAVSGYTETGYEAVITTDIEIEIPYINFFRDSSVILDYALIGNEGIYFTGANSDDGRSIEGNVYAGISADETPDNLKTYYGVEAYKENEIGDYKAVFGGINIHDSTVNFESNYLISKGDINIKASKVTIGNATPLVDAQIWAETVRTTEDIDKSKAAEETMLTVNGNMFIANDLELNARESKVTLNGSYYGYSNGTFVGIPLENQEKQISMLSGNATEHTQSSAIIINGNKSELDLSGLDTLVIAGVAYVDLQSQAYAGEAINNEGGSSTGKIEEIATGEALALRTNQYMYLAPTTCLTVPNPVKASELSGSVWQEGATWFGVNKGYVDASDPVTAKEVMNRTTGEVFVYFFLNFVDDTKRKEYTNVVLNMIDPENNLSDMDAQVKTKWNYNQFSEAELKQIWEVKQTITSRAMSDAVKPAITLTNGATANIYTRAAITQIAGDSLSSQFLDETKMYSLDYVTKMGRNLVKHYQYLYAELNPRSDVPLYTDNDVLPSIGSVDINAPVSQFVNFDGMVNGADSPDYKCGYKTHVYSGDFTLTNSNFQGIIICDGNVTITGGSNVEGLVIARKKIFVEGNGKITANRSIVQAILDEELEEEAKKASATERNMKYASTYLRAFKRPDAEYTGKDYSNRVSSTDYVDYISYQNWRKGEVN